jgi:glutathione-regulated potassium-efflux system ancillary protein KefG
MVNTDDLSDAHALAELLGLRHPNSVSTYQRRYADMPRPVVDLGPGRPKLWLRGDILAWAENKKR